MLCLVCLLACFALLCFSARIPRLSLIQHSLYVGVFEKLLPHHSQGSSTERWSRNTLRVVTARVFYVLRGVLTSPFIFNNSVETAALFNVVNHPRYCEPRNYSPERLFRPLAGIEPVTVGNLYPVLNR